MSVKTYSYHALRTLTSQGFRERVKARAQWTRLKAAPLLNAWYGNYQATDLEASICARIRGDFEILMVHSSISNMRPMFQGTMQDVLHMLQRIVGRERTLAMPAFFFGSAENYNRSYYRKNPRFDVKRTPSQMGLLSELFRRSPGVVRSLHPTHSVCALGPLAQELVSMHHISPWACGELSPFGVMGRRRTLILGIGTEYFRSLTQVHAAEEMLSDQFPIPRESEDPVRVEIITLDGGSIPYEMSRPLSRRVILKLERLRDIGGTDIIEEWSFRGTKLYLTEAKKVDAAVRSAAMRGETLYVQK